MIQAFSVRVQQLAARVEEVEAANTTLLETGKTLKAELAVAGALLQVTFRFVLTHLNV